MKSLQNLILKSEVIEKISKITQIPYIFRLQKGDKKLVYFGASHQFDSNNPEFEQIKQEFNSLHPQLVLWEGAVNMDLSSEENAKKQGEAVYTNWLAKEAGVKSKNLDIPIGQDATYQAEKFGKEAVFVFFCVRTLNTLYLRMDQGQKINEKIITEALENRIKLLKNTLDWDIEFSISNLLKSFKETTGKKLSLDIKKWQRELIGPNYYLGILN